MSETARDGGQSAAGCQAPCVIVAVFREQARSCTNLALCLLCDAPRHGGFARHLPFRPHIAHYLGAIGGLAGLFRRWRWCGRRWRWRTGAAAENDCAERQGCKNAFPKTFHRLTRDKRCTHLCDNRTPPESSRGGRRNITFVLFYRAFSRPGMANLAIPTLPGPGVAGCCFAVRSAILRAVPPPIRVTEAWPRSTH